jgi:cell division transport system permease protein
MLAFLAFSLSRAWQGLWRNALMSLAATATMTLMLLLLAGFWVLRTGLVAGLEYVEQKVEVVADLNDSATPAQVESLRTKLAALPEVASVTYISKDEALARFRAYLAAQGEEDLTRYLDTNPLQASLEVKLKDPRNYGTVMSALAGDPAVADVKDIGALVDRVVAITGAIRTIGLAVLAVVALVVLFIVVNTIRLAVVARRDEIEIMRLVGATDAFIRWPFVFEGALVGLLGAAITLGILALAAQPASRLLYDLFRIVPLQLGSLARDLVLLVVGTGLGLGTLGAWLSVRAYLSR